MTNQDAAMQRAIADQLNAEIAGRRWKIKEFARRMNRQYDSTRNYLVGERDIPLPFLLEAATVLGVPAEEIVSRARAQQLDKYLKSDPTPPGK